MDLQVEILGSSILLQFTARLVRDWADKIKEECQKSENKCQLSKYNVLIAQDKQQDGIEINSNYDLIVILQGTTFNIVHIYALSEQLSLFGQTQNPFVPTYIGEVALANCVAIAILQYLVAYLTQNSNKKHNKIHRLNCIDCMKYFGVCNYSAKAYGVYENKRGQNPLDGGAPFYAVYPTKKGLLTVGSIEGKFYQEMIDQMGLKSQDLQYLKKNQMNNNTWPRMRQIFSQKFMQKTAEEWEKIMSSRDTCVAEIKQELDIKQKFLHPNLVKPKL